MENNTLHVMSALVVRSPFDESILAEYEKTGNKADVEWAPTTVLMDNIKNGARADAIIATVSAVDSLIEQGIVDPSSRIELVDSKLGLAVKKGEAHPDISTVEALKETLLNARSVAYSVGGASGIYFQDLLKKMGIADEVNAKASPIPQGFTAEQIVAGNADVAIQQVSELLVVKGIEVIGTLPESVQSTTSFSAVTFKGSSRTEQARGFLNHLLSDGSVQAYKHKGLEMR
jgi:molybdate transport system substrate-binding protein